MCNELGTATAAATATAPEPEPKPEPEPEPRPKKLPGPSASPPGRGRTRPALDAVSAAAGLRPAPRGSGARGCSRRLRERGREGGRTAGEGPSRAGEPRGGRRRGGGGGGGRAGGAGEQEQEDGASYAAPRRRRRARDPDARSARCSAPIRTHPAQVGRGAGKGREGMLGGGALGAAEARPWVPPLCLGVGGGGERAWRGRRGWARGSPAALANPAPLRSGIWGVGAWESE